MSPSTVAPHGCDLAFTVRAGSNGKPLPLVCGRQRHRCCDLLLLCTNTMHKVADRITDAVGIPLLHIADATATAVHAAGLRTVGLLGTAFTMEQSFYSDRLASRGLTVLVPEADDRALVHSVIYDELCRGLITEPSRVAYIEVIHRLAASGAQGVILGCTEIELLISQDDSPIPVFPTTRLHVEAAVTQSLADEGLSGSP
jgi:aspartate racemase